MSLDADARSASRDLGQPDPPSGAYRSGPAHPKPPRLRPGDTVALVAPANPWESRSDLLRGIAALEGWGLRVKLGDHVHDRHGYMAGRDEDRAADLNAAFADPELRAIICLQGGYGSPRLIRHLDREVIRAHPKLLCGYSDITALHLAIQAWSEGGVSLYSNGAAGIGSAELTDFSRDHLHRALFGSEHFGEIPRDPDDPWVRTIVGGSASGLLTGGCLSLVAATIGTAIEIDTRDRVVVFEDVDTAPYVIDGHLTHLLNAGKLADAAGIVFGETIMHRDDTLQDLSLEDVLEEVLGPLGIPCLYGLPIGHGKHHATVPIGAHARLDADAGRLVVDEVITSD